MGLARTLGVTPLTPITIDPSRTLLLRRAAALPPMRASFQSLTLWADPIVGLKRAPDVAARRARFTRVVKLTVGICLAICMLAAVVHVATGTARAAAPPRAPAYVAQETNPRGDTLRTKAQRPSLRAVKPKASGRR